MPWSRITKTAGWQRAVEEANFAEILQEIVEDGRVLVLLPTVDAKSFVRSGEPSVD